MLTIGIEDLDAALERVRSRGGTLEDNVIGLWQDTMQRQEA